MRYSNWFYVRRAVAFIFGTVSLIFLVLFGIGRTDSFRIGELLIAGISVIGHEGWIVETPSDAALAPKSWAWLFFAVVGVAFWFIAPRDGRVIDEAWSAEDDRKRCRWFITVAVAGVIIGGLLGYLDLGHVGERGSAWVYDALTTVVVSALIVVLYRSIFHLIKHEMSAISGNAQTYAALTRACDAGFLGGLVAIPGIVRTHLGIAVLAAFGCVWLAISGIILLIRFIFPPRSSAT